jgi:hypothetical protein
VKPCPLCSHAGVNEINRRLIGGTDAAAVAREYKVPHRSAIHHRRYHLPRLLQRLRAGEELLSAQGLVAILVKIKDNIEAVIAEAVRTHNPILRLAATRELRGYAELLARLTRRLGPEVAVTVNIEQVMSDEEATRAAKVWLERHALPEAVGDQE